MYLFEIFIRFITWFLYVFIKYLLILTFILRFTNTKLYLLM